ncbi:MAG TPA: Dyp-type peroxidase [Acidimicrobiales bacterium]|nr:Dyp-type peroxidase [Acidimicrobiales bacterium]
MTAPQPGIFAQGTRAHYYLEYDLQPNASPDAVLRALRSLREPPVTAGGANLVLAFSRRLWQQLSPDDAPPQLRHFDAVKGPAGTAPATQHDIWLWTHGTNSDVVVDVARAATVALGPVAKLAHEQPAFVYQESRDFLGFVDGTENPPVWEAHLAAIVPDGETGAGGSFVLTQKWVHDLGRFEELPDDEQERVFGRTKQDSEELDDDVRPADSHISRVVIEDDDGDEVEIYRRSTPWGTVTEQGLMFVAFSNDLTTYDRMLARMFGTSGDGTHDRVTDFSTPVSGAYYFAPSLADLYGVFGKI